MIAFLESAIYIYIQYGSVMSIETSAQKWYDTDMPDIQSTNRERDGHTESSIPPLPLTQGVSKFMTIDIRNNEVAILNVSFELTLSNIYYPLVTA